MKNSRSRHGTSCTVLSTLLFLACVPSSRANSWTNTGFGDWFVGTNWSTGDVPVFFEDVVVNNGGSAVINGPEAEAGKVWIGYFGSSGGYGSLRVFNPSPGVRGYLAADQISVGKVSSTAAGSTITGELIISGSGHVEADEADANGFSVVIGDGSLGGGPAVGTITVTGAGSLYCNGGIALGLGNATGTFVMDNGAEVITFGGGFIGHGSATVKGSQTIWHGLDRLFVGYKGATNSSLDILTGGLVETSSMQLYNGLVRVDNGSSTVAGLTILGGQFETADASNGQMVVGDHAAGRMVISQGGHLVSYRGFVGGSSDGVGSALVSEPGSKWKASGSIWIGNAGNGTLDVLDGGTLTSEGNGYLGFENTGAGYATIDGPNSAWTMAASLFIGGTGLAPGGFGQLVIQNGAVVSAAAVTLYNTGRLLLGANASLNGDLTVKGGTIGASNNMTFTKNFTLGTEGGLVETNGFIFTFSGAISGTGGLTKGGSFTGSGPGTLTLTGHSTYSGPTTISFGKLVVDGSISSPVTVMNGGVLGGHGAVGGIIVTNSGVVTPGNSPGVLTVNGNYTQQSSGILNIEIGGPAPGTGFDRIAMSGKATIDGTLNLSLVNGYRPTVGETFAIITSISQSGNFSTINSSGFTVRSDASANGIVLTVTDVVPGVPVITSSTSASGTQNQAFSYQIAATESPTSFDASGLPPGLSVDPASGVISGTPTTIGSFDVTISATNSVATGSATLTLAITPPPPGLVGNVSTRLPVGAGDDVLIEGFIVQGPAGSTKKIIVRAIGPSLLPFGIADALANPTLEIHDTNNATVATNDDWKNTQVGGLILGDQAAEINASGVAPGNDLESAIIADLAPGSYTAVVHGLGNAIGTGVVDAYDLSAASPARLANIATRGLIQPGDKLMIAGFIVQNGPVRAVIRAVGPSLVAFGIANALADTTLQLKDQNGTTLLENDNWETDQKQELENTGLQPSHNLEAAVVVTIQPGQYTAQVRGKPETTGIGVVQVYFLQ